MVMPLSPKRTIMDIRSTASSEDPRANAAGQSASPDPNFSMFNSPDVLSSHGAPAVPPSPVPQPSANNSPRGEPAREAAKVSLDPEAQKLVNKAVFRVKAIFFGSLLAAAGVMALVMTIDAFRPLRLWLNKRHADDLVWRIDWAVLGGIPLWLMLMWLVVQIARRSDRKKLERTLRQGTERASQATQKVYDKVVEDMRQAGATEAEIAEFRATTEEVRLKSLAENEARIKDWTEHPEHILADMERVQAEIAAREAAEAKSTSPNSA